MRGALVMLIGGALLSAGCSMMIASCGKDVAGCSTREEARAAFGTPVDSSTEGGKDYDLFRYRGKLSRSGFGPNPGPAMMIAMTFGLSEIVTFPWELARASGDVLLGSEVKFWYTANGLVCGCDIDGEALPIWKDMPRATPEVECTVGEPSLRFELR